MTEHRSTSNIIYAADRFAARRPKPISTEAKRAREIAERVKALVGVGP